MVCLKTDIGVKLQSITLLLALVGTLIPQEGGVPVAQQILRQVVVSPLGITFVLAVLVCTYMTHNIFILLYYFCM